MATSSTATDLAGHFDYLDRLRESGTTNMFGAATYLEAERGLPLADARKVLSMWMGSFAPNLSVAQRVHLAIANLGNLTGA